MAFDKGQFPDYILQLAPNGFLKQLKTITSDDSGVIVFNLLTQVTTIEPVELQCRQDDTKQLMPDEP